MDRLMARDKLYRYTVMWAIVFTMISGIIMVVFKLNETYFDTYSAAVLRQDTDTIQQEQSYPRYHVEVELADKAQAQFILPMTQMINSDNIRIAEEFLENRLTITLYGAAPCVANGTQVTIDSAIMDAVGIYRQQEDIVLELYCNDTYGYEVTQKENQLIVSFAGLREQYDILSVLYVPAKDMDRLRRQDMQELDKLAAGRRMKLYKTYELETAYTQEQVTEFANRIHADMLLGVEIEEGVGTENVTALCNSEYFIPEFGSVELAAVMADCMSRSYGAGSVKVVEADDRCPLVMNAAIPAAMAVYQTGQSAGGEPQLEYDVNRKLINALTDMYKQIFASETFIE